MNFDLDAVFAKLKPLPVTFTYEGKPHTMRPLTRAEFKSLDTFREPAEGETLAQLNQRTLTFLRTLFDVPPPIFPESLPDDPEAAQEAMRLAAGGFAAVYTVANEHWSDAGQLKRVAEESRRQVQAQFATRSV